MRGVEAWDGRNWRSEICRLWIADSEDLGRGTFPSVLSI